MPFPPKQQPGQQPPKPDGEVEGYERVVNGKVVKVNAYGKKATSTTKALTKARLMPGRPRMAGKPGTFSGGRDIPGQKFVVPREPPPMIVETKGQPGGKSQPDPRKG